MFDLSFLSSDQQVLGYLARVPTRFFNPNYIREAYPDDTSQIKVGEGLELLMVILHVPLPYNSTELDLGVELTAFSDFR